ncbi:MAG TPA: ABC transporter ATP-binding protein, partial [Vicinamibacterales bacterium]|nr:ABC transporter ATP-binding protein [Vicinamibacterales bacterium]
MRGQTTEVHSATRGKIDATIHALRDVSFDVKEGAGLGIIGRNGAGKTTLLKMISRVTWPTSGTVRVAGHVVSLIELGAGFHPELTGRENVYLGAGLFGLTRKEIDRQFDAIVSFADVERLIDTPMKRYSSGLYARLGFSVAIHSNPDIVLVDEVLAVGDASFRRRAMEALRSLISSGKTVLFISHDMWNVRRLCSDILWMENGSVRAYGEAGAIAETYMNEVNLQAMQNQATSLQSHRGGTGEVRFEHVDLYNANGAPSATFAQNDTLVIRGAYMASKAVESPVFQVAIVDIDTGVVVTTASTANRPAGQQASGLAGIVEGPGEIEIRFAHLPLRPRQYVLRLSITDAFQLASYDVVTAGPRFAITGRGAGVDSLADEQDGLVTLPFDVAHRSGPQIKHRLVTD